MSTTQIPPSTLKIKRFASQFRCSIIALVLMNVCPVSRPRARPGARIAAATVTPEQKKSGRGSDQNRPGSDRALQGCRGGET